MNATEFISPGAAANLILAGLALLLMAMGALGWWVTAHPAKAQAFLYRLRRHPRAMRAEERYRTQIDFLVRRFQPEGAFGLSFTIGLTARRRPYSEEVVFQKLGEGDGVGAEGESGRS